MDRKDARNVRVDANCLSFSDGEVLADGLILRKDNIGEFSLKLGFLPDESQYELIDKLPRMLRLLKDRFNPPEIFEETDKHQVIKRLHLVPVSIPEKPRRELNWRPGNAYGVGTVVQSNGKVWEAAQKIPVGTELKSPAWKMVTKTVWRLQKLFREGTDIRYIELDTYQGVFANDGYLLPESIVGEVAILGQARSSQDGSGARGWADHYFLAMRPGSSVKFRSDGGVEGALAYPVDIRFRERECAVCGVIAFLSWDAFQTWTERNPRWNRRSESIPGLPIAKGPLERNFVPPRKDAKPEGKTLLQQLVGGELSEASGPAVGSTGETS